MGARCFGSNAASYLTNPINPNPKNFTIVDSVSYGRYTVCLINYPNCTNFEGDKILIVKDVDVKSLLEIDPHFTKDGFVFARFEPTDEGWVTAAKFAFGLSIGERND